jgi:hypothetical protein
MHLAFHGRVRNILYVVEGDDVDLAIRVVDLELGFTVTSFPDVDEEEEEEIPPIDRSDFGVPDEPRPPSQTPSRRPSISEDPQGGRKKTRKVKRSKKRTTYRINRKKRRTTRKR